MSDTDYSKAWRAFIESSEGIACADPVSLGLSVAMQKYVENRLNLAFANGWTAAMETIAKQVAA